jgi:hypothetical protein
MLSLRFVKCSFSLLLLFGWIVRAGVWQLKLDRHLS